MKVLGLLVREFRVYNIGPVEEAHICKDTYNSKQHAL